jgi:hypothetical protein
MEEQMPAKRAHKRPMPNYQSFYSKIADWEPSYSFAREDSKEGFPSA